MVGPGTLGPDLRWRVFVSHTSELRDFPRGQSYVAAVERAVAASGHVTVDMADFPATDLPSARLCTERVESCDVYIGVLGTRYGSPVRDRPEVSYTELEFETATEAGLHRLVFTLDTEAEATGIPPSRLIDLEFGQRQEAFRGRVQAVLGTRSFADPGTLGQLVERSLRELAAKQKTGDEAGPPARLWGNVPARNPGFKGRKGLLEEVREALLSGDRAVVQALHGMGGVGKTQLAAEYAHRFADSYDLVWWIACEQPGLIGHQFTALAEALGCARPGAGVEATRRAVMARLHDPGRWLLVFDNAESPEDLSGWLPGGTGHALITSRAPGWADIAVPVEIGVLDRAESVAILQDRLPSLADGDADRIADAVGDLALAVAQAGGYVTGTGLPAREYIALLKERTADMMRAARPATYPQPLAAVTQLALNRLRAEEPTAAAVAVLCAFLAPEPVPAHWFPRAAAALPVPLARKAADPVTWHQVLAAGARSALVRVADGEVQMHRLTQAIIRSQLTARQAASSQARAKELLTASHRHIGSRYSQSPGTWPEWARLLPHLFALDPRKSDSPQLRALAAEAAWYLAKRGDARASYDLARHLHAHWQNVLGADDPDTLHAQYVLAHALRLMGRYQEAHDLDEDNLTRCRQVLGENHIRTLNAANALAGRLKDLGNTQAARELLGATLSRARLVLGEDHPDTIGFASNLATHMRYLGEAGAARQLHEDALARSRRVLGDDHPETISYLAELGIDMRELSQADTARQLHEDALARYSRILGEDHPDTIGCALSLGIDMRELGRADTARQLHETALGRFSRVLGEDHPVTLNCITELAADLRAAGDPQTARDLDEKALSGLRRTFGDDHPRIRKIAPGLESEKITPDIAATE